VASIENIGIWIVSIYLRDELLHDAALSGSRRHLDDEVLYLSRQYLFQVFGNQFVVVLNLEVTVAINGKRQQVFPCHLFEELRFVAHYLY
jgi:hypothetical protein